jgi:hypothetical protein
MIFQEANMRQLTLLLATLPAVALAANAPTPSRIGVLIIPMDKAAESHVVQLEKFSVEALQEFQGLNVKQTDDLFGLPKDEDAEASLKRAELGYKESKTAFDGRNWEDAERKLRATIKEYTKAAGALSSCGHLCDAVAMYAASLNARGEVEEAKIAVLDLLALSPTFELDKKRYPQEFVSLRAQVATARNAQLRGNVDVKTRPGGARVYLDGEFKGYSPVTLQTLPIGKHMLRLERPGFKVWGTLVEVSPEDSEVKQELAPTPGYKAYDAMVDNIASDILKDKAGGQMKQLGKTLGLDRAVVAVLKEVQDSGSTEMAIGLFDLREGKRLAGKRAAFQGDEFGQLKGEIARVVTHLLNTAAGSTDTQKSKSSDPLDSHSGMEEWTGDDFGGKRNSKEKKSKAKDPLDGVSGQEDW